MGWLSSDLYIQIDKGWSSVTNLDTGDEVTSATIVAVPRRKGEKPRLVNTSGLEAATIEEKQGRIKLADGFGHERVLVGDFLAAEVALRTITRHVLPNRWKRVGGVLIHIRRELRGGYTEIELRAVRDLVSLIGPKQFYFYERPNSLSPREAKRLLGADPKREPNLSY
jgi:hypothetical protein